MARDPQMRIRPGPPIAAALTATGGEEFPTGRLNAVCERYLAMIETVRPVFSRAEWLAIFAVLPETGLAGDIASSSDDPVIPVWHALPQEITDARGLDHWGVSPAALARKVAALPEPARIAIVETAQRFWALAHLSDSQALDLATSHPATWP